MKHDLCVKMEDGILNIRVGAIIMKDDKFLMVENDRFDHMCDTREKLNLMDA